MELRGFEGTTLCLVAWKWPAEWMTKRHLATTATIRCCNYCPILQLNDKWIIASFTLCCNTFLTDKYQFWALKMVRWRLWSFFYTSQIYNNQLVGDLPWKMSSNTNETIDQDYATYFFMCQGFYGFLLRNRTNVIYLYVQDIALVTPLLLYFCLPPSFASVVKQLLLWL